MKRNLPQTLLFLFIVMHVLWSVQACKNCGEYRTNTENMVTVFKMIDTTQLIQKISYLGSSYEIFPNADSSEFLLSTSDSVTHIVVTTSIGVDSISFFQSKNIAYYALSDCDRDARVYISRGFPVILGHTFDSIYTVSEVVPYSNTFLDYDVLRHLRYTICIK